MRSAWVLLAVIGIVAVKPAGAAPNFLGTTGLLVIPSADVLAEHQWNVHAHFIDRDSQSSFGGNFGLFKNLEVGVTGLHVPGSTIGIVNAKYQLVPERGNAPAIAVGAVDIADRLNIDASIYGVLSKSLGSLGGAGGGYPLRGHLGFGRGIFDDNVFGGVDLLINPRLLLMAEYDGRNFNFGGRLGLSPDIRVDLGSLDGDFGAGISYRAQF